MIERTTRVELDGFVYFLADEEWTKIGWSGAPTLRLEKLRGISRRDLKLLATFPGTKDEEAALHRHFRHLMVKEREWFKNDPTITDLIAELKRLGGGIGPLLKRLRTDEPLPAVHLPADATKFKKWADEACRTWPGELQALAWRAWFGLTKGSPDKLDEFATEYGLHLARGGK